MVDIKFSVVVPVFNKGAHVERMLASVLNQEYAPAEVIIVDDGSTDDSIPRIRSYEHEISSIIKIITQPNLGVAAARNRGISEVIHNYVALIDADDEWLPNHLTDIHALIQKYPDCIAYSCNHILKNEADNAEVVKGRSFRNRLVLIESFLDGAARYSILNSSTVVLNGNKLTIKEVFPEGIRVGEDLFAWFSAIGCRPVGYCSSVGAVIHQEGDPQRENRRKLPSYLIEHIYCNKITLSHAEYKYIWKIWLAHYYGSVISNQYMLSLKYLKYGLRIFGVTTTIYTIMLVIPPRVLVFFKKIYKEFRR